MENLFETIVALKKSGDFAALAIIVRTEGSTPRRVGTKMLVLKDGKTIGTMGGGDLEKRVIEEALEAIRQGEPRITSFTLDIERGKLDMMCGGKLDVYIEPILPKGKLIIFGAGHITRSLAPLMKGAGFKVSVVEDSPDLLQKDKFPETEDLVLTDMEQFAKNLPSDPRTYVVLLSRGFSKDKAILNQLIQKDFKYIGMIGSVRKINTVREDLQKKGIPQDAFYKFWAPIGLDIGAETPEEIAISIAAEIIAARRAKLETLKKKGEMKNVTE
jgi:xanthine dehydrogenase accessory factor